MMNRIKKDNYKDFDAIKLTLASPEDVLSWSYGEVTKAETINYRTFRPEPEGLFCEKIFGPSKNYECYCGKYKKIRYKGIVCDKCGVEVTTKSVRRDRMGHIKLSVPVVHVWFAYSIPNKLSIVLDMPHKKLLSVIYYTRYMVVDVQRDKRDETIKKVEKLKLDELDKVEKDLAESLASDQTEHDGEIKKLKKEEKNPKALEFKTNQVEYKFKQSQAKTRKQFAEIEESVDAFYTKLAKLIEKIEVGGVLTEEEYIDLADRDLVFFDAKMGAEAVEALLKKIDLEKEIVKLNKLAKTEKGENKSTTIRRLQYLEGFRKNSIRPEWMVMNILPVIPPELRPIILLSGGKFATSDLNDLYRRIINRNNRLARLISIGAPDVILRNEKRMLQEAVDALIDNSHRPSKPMMNNKKLPYQSLTDELRGKKGIFRRNLLGKRVDYSGRAVIIGDATLKLNQCGFPKSIALEVYKPFVINKLLELEFAPNIRIAKDMIEAGDDIIWDILEDVIKGRPVMLNRAPTLHKYSIQAFYPRLVEGEAIRIHPLICKAFNADFDGDQMSLHVVLTDEALTEVKERMLAEKNIVNISNGKLLANPTKDMLMGYFLLTDLAEVKKPKMFGSFDDAKKAFERGNITATELIIVKGKGEVIKTSVGRVIFNSVLPEDYPFVNIRIGDTEVRRIVEDVRIRYPLEVCVKLLDDLKDLGFKYATDLAFSFSMSDCKVDIDMKEKLKGIEEKEAQLQENYLQGLSTQEERLNLSVNMWQDFADAMVEEAWKKFPKDNSIYQMIESNTNGSKIQVRQIVTLKGMVRDSSGNWVPLPIKGNFRDGLNAFEYFVASNTGRKGIADRSLRTSSSGYLTRKLVDVAHDVIIRMDDCGYDGKGLKIGRSDDRRLGFEDRIYGRIAASDILDKKGKVIVEKNLPINREAAQKIDKSEINEVYVRTPILCNSPIGVCQNCYGYDLEQDHIIDMGKAVGVIAAQSIGEPGTQMTMQTFHKGGVQRTDITQGLPRIEELFEARSPKAEAEMSTINGKAKVEVAEDDSATISIEGTRAQDITYVVSDVVKIAVTDGSKVKMGQLLFIDADSVERQARFDGVVTLKGGLLTVIGNKKATEVINVLPNVTILVKDGDDVYAGQALTEGSLDPKKLAKIDIFTTQKYVLDEIQKVFNEQGVSLDDVHIETIIRQTARLGRVLSGGDSGMLVGSLVSKYISGIKNEMLLEQGKNVAYVQPRFMGIKASALYTESFLSAMSFEQQVRVLTSASIVGTVDYLRGMKENVIVGRDVPSGKGVQITDVRDIEEIKII
ncbi:DNA-directed RNA polymerase subunit beta' [Candidatus Dojkabacteria bacterium]|jgi:DNA-directed RNA polymerase subunit beta'|nr:DNA-directed RNA polymerase subunit beta' [Candidatus Dojkabacteria bacterium]